MPETGGMIAVEVVFMPAAGAPFLRALVVPAGSTVAEAIRASGLESVHPEAAWQVPGNLGIYGERVPPERALHAGDRIEIYRALRIDPMQARRARAARSKP